MSLPCAACVSPHRMQWRNLPGRNQTGIPAADTTHPARAAAARPPATDSTLQPRLAMPIGLDPCLGIVLDSPLEDGAAPGPRPGSGVRNPRRSQLGVLIAIALGAGRRPPAERACRRCRGPGRHARRSAHGGGAPGGIPARSRGRSTSGTDAGSRRRAGTAARPATTRASRRLERRVRDTGTARNWCSLNAKKRVVGSAPADSIPFGQRRQSSSALDRRFAGAAAAARRRQPAEPLLRRGARSRPDPLRAIRAGPARGVSPPRSASG